MRTQIMADVAPNFVTLTPNLFHHNNVKITYAGTSNFIMELVKSIPSYSMAMPYSMLIITKVPFIITPINPYHNWYEVQTTNFKGNKPHEYACKDA